MAKKVKKIEKKLTTKDIAPCPFCGKKPKLMEGWGAPAGVGTAWCAHITCYNSKCGVRPQLSHFTTDRTTKGIAQLKTEIITGWNQRA